MSLSPSLARIFRETTGKADRLENGFDLVAAIREGLPASAVDNLVKSGKLTLLEIDKVVLPRKTLAHRRQIGTLTQGQGDRVVRVMRVIALAEDTFGNEVKAGTWLRRPTVALHGEAPIELLDTDEGAREVETILTRIAHGIAA